MRRKSGFIPNLDMDSVGSKERLNAPATTTVAELLHDPDEGWVNI